jgi:hypothetical protein
MLPHPFVRLSHRHCTHANRRFFLNNSNRIHETKQPKLQNLSHNLRACTAWRVWTAEEGESGRYRQEHGCTPACTVGRACTAAHESCSICGDGNAACRKACLIHGTRFLSASTQTTFVPFSCSDRGAARSKLARLDEREPTGQTANTQLDDFRTQRGARDCHALSQLFSV